MITDAEEFVAKVRNRTITEEDFSRLIDAVIRKAVEESLRALPTVINHLTKQAQTLHVMANDFYAKHPELKDHKNLVTRIVERLEGENPGLSYEEILEKAAPIALSQARMLPGLKDKKGRPSLVELDSALGEL